jgi:MGT family glycosyltransferase
MAKYVFLNIGAHGHVNPTLAVVQELVKRGHEVSYYLIEEFRSIIEATGAVFRPYEVNPALREVMAGGGMFQPGNAPAKMPNLKEITAIPPDVLERVRVERPDVILYDSMCFWAREVVDELHIPAITFFTSYAANKHFNIMDQMKAANAKGISGAAGMFAQMAKMGPSAFSLMKEFSRMASHFEEFNIVFIPKEYQPKAETFDESYLFVGPSILPRHDAPDFPFEQLKSNLPLLYISLGSVFTNQVDFYKHCFAAFGEQSWQVVLSIGKNTDLTTLGPVPENFLLAGYVPQLELLPRAHLFVTHGGANSVMESIYFGVPTVLIPQQPEQHMNAQRTVELGMGVLLEKEDVTAQTLRAAVGRVSNDATYRENTQRMQQAIRAEGGYQAAADGIERFTAQKAKPQKIEVKR